MDKRTMDQLGAVIVGAVVALALAVSIFAGPESSDAGWAAPTATTAPTAAPPTPTFSSASTAPPAPTPEPPTATPEQLNYLEPVNP